MLNHLRLRLTLLYLLAALLLVSVVGASAYSLLYYYFMSSNDNALRYKMATTFVSLGIQPPSELEESLNNWEGHQEQHETNDKVDKTESETNDENRAEQLALSRNINYEGELSSIFVFPLNAQGQMILNPNPFSPPMKPDIAAVTAALKLGSDIRTAALTDGTPVRLLTYTVPVKSGFEILQLGKSFSDQVRLMNQFLIGLIISGGIVILLVGFGSWWVAGRSLRPTQKAWEMQQNFIANASHELRTP
ncbi:MAG TPA: hypothetical protein VF338_12340, partial [Leptolinea sp.]